MTSKTNVTEIKCLEKDFFSRMTKETPTDCSSTTKQQIDTENIIKAEYEEFLHNFINDPE